MPTQKVWLRERIGPIKEQTKELKEQQLNEDKEDEFIGVKTKAQHKTLIDKKLRFDLNQNTEHKENT